MVSRALRGAGALMTTGSPPLTPPETSHEELGGLVRRGVGWAMASQGVMQVMALMTSIVVAHFLSPRQVGLASEGVVFVTLALVVNDFGVGAVIVQRARLSEVEVATLFWIGVALGVVLTGLGVALSPLIADLYGEPQVQGLFAVMSFTFLVTAPGIVPLSLLTRELRFRSLELRTIVATVTSCTIAIVLAASGAGPWAIVVQTLTMAGVSTALVWRTTPWRPRLAFSLHALGEFRSYASDVLGSKIVVWANGNVDNLLVGRFAGASPLGAYSLAFAVALTPVNRIAVPITQVLFPAFSKLREPDRIGVMWLRATKVLAVVVVPALVGLIVVAPDFVRIVFGVKWRHAAPVMQILAGVALLQTLTALNDAILSAIAETRLLFRFRTALSVATLVAFGIGLNWGIDGASVAYLIVSVVLHPVYVWLTVRLVGVTLREWLAGVARVAAAGAGMLAVLVLVRHIYLHAGVPAGLRLVSLGVIGGLVYVALVVVLVPDAVEEIRAARARRRVGQPA